MSERILVTGGAGFIGSHIVDALIGAGHDVVVVDNLHTGRRENLNPAARFYLCDVRDGPALEQVFANEKPTVICHQAALADVRRSLREPAVYAAVNVIGTLNVLEAARACGTVRRFLFASTGGAIYGDPQELPATEGCPVRPLDPYGASKLACEYFMDTYRHNYGLEICVLRYANVYGPRQDPNGEAGVVAIFAGAMLAGRPVVINGDGTQSRDFVFVGDIARANLLALHLGSGIYNLGSGLATDINAVCRQLAQLTGYALPERHGPAKQGEVYTTYLDAGRARRELGWEAATSLREGLATTVACFRKSGSEGFPCATW
jgi:UDP-glucose 4-epimerase